MVSHRSLLGRHGEDTASTYCRVLGYRLIGRNVRMERHEIDIIAYDDATSILIFVEVKARMNMDEDYRPELGFTWEKRRHLRRAVRKWIARHRYEGRYRIDLVAIAGGKVVNHVEDVEL